MKNLLLLTAFVAIHSSLVAQTNTTWNGTTNPWNSANWSAGVPINATFNAIINSGTVTLDAAYNINALTLANPTITGAQTLTTSSLATLSGSPVLTGGMTLQANGGLSITSSPTFNNATVNVPAGQTAIYTGSTLTMSNSAVINNAGTWFARTNFSFFASGAGVKSFNNTGTFTRDVAVGTFQPSVVFNNTGGIVNAQTGTLDLFGGGASTGGTFNVDAGATLKFNTGQTFDAASVIQGLGTVNFGPNSGAITLTSYNVAATVIGGSSPGTINFNNGAGGIGALSGAGSAIANFNGTASPTSVSVGGNTFNFANNVSTSAVSLASGTLTIASGKTFDMSGSLTLGGTLGGAGVFNANAGGSFTSGGLTGTTLNIPSGQTFTNGGFSTFNFASSSTLNNAGTYFAQNGFGIFGGSGTNVVNNSGTLTRNTSAGTFQISTRFNNTGIVNANTGTLDLFSGGTSTGGVFNVASGATLKFGNGHTFDGATFIQGAGSASFAPTTGTATISHYDIGTGTTIAGGSPGTINFNDPVGSIGVLTGTGSAIANFNGTASPTSVSVGGNTFNFANNVSTGAVSLGGGTLTIASGKTFDINGALALGGTLGGPGVFNANAGGAFTSGGLSATTLNLPAGQTFTNGGFTSFAFANSSTFNNAGTYLAQNGFGITSGSGTNVFNNLPGSVFTRDTNAGSFTVSSAFNNASTVNANTGTLWLQGGGTATNGAFNIASGATLVLGAAQTFNATSSITGVGTAKVIFSNTGTLNVTNYSVTGTTQLGFSGGGGVTNLNNGAGSIGAVVGILPGTINFNGTASPTSVTTSGGALLAFFNDATTATLSASGDGQVNVAPGKILNVIGATTMFGGPAGRGRFGGGGVVLASGGFSTSGEGILDTGILTIPVGATATQATFSDHISARNGSTINNAGTWRAQSSAIISINGTGPNVFNNSGTLLHDTSAAIAFIDIDTFNTGLISAPLGQLTFSRAFTQTAGEFRATTTGQLNLTQNTPGAFNGGQITGAGIISGAAAVAGATVAPNGILNFITGTRFGDLTTTAASTIAIDIGGTTPGTGHDQINEVGVLPFTRNGTLAVRFTGGFQNTILPTDTFTVMTSNQATVGQFANVSGGRFQTADGLGTFAINAPGTNFVILSAWQPNPDIAVEYPVNTDLVDNVGTVAWAARSVGSSEARTFTIRNLGLGNLTGLGITVTGTNPADFVVTTPVTGAPAATIVPAGSETFIVTFTPQAIGLRSAILNIASNDPDENPFRIRVEGTGLNSPPTISNITDRTINENTSTGAVPFTIGDNETPAGTLTLTGASSDLALVPLSGIVFGGSGANRTVTVTPAANQSGTATITVTVSDGTDTVSDSFVLTVTAVTLGGTPIATRATPPPGVSDGATYLSFFDACMNNENRVMFTAQLAGGSGPSADHGIWTQGANGNLSLLMRAGMDIDGSQAVGRVLQFQRLADSGVGMLQTNVINAGPMLIAQWIDDGVSNVSLFAKRTTRFDSIPACCAFTGFGYTSQNQLSGDGFFAANLVNGGAGVGAVTTANDGGVWKVTDDGMVTAAVREGETLPANVGIGFTQGEVMRVAVSPGNQGVYRGLLNGTGVTSNSSVVVLTRNFTTLADPALVARTDEAAADCPPGCKYYDFLGETINSNGKTLVWATLTGTGVTGGTDRALFSDRTGRMALVIRYGDDLSATFGSGLTLSSINTLWLLDDGKIVLKGTLTGAGVTNANDQFVAMISTTGLVTKLVREGDVASAIGGSTISVLNAVDVSPGGKIAVLASTLNGTGDSAGNLNNQGLLIGDVASPGVYTQVLRKGSIIPGGTKRIWSITMSQQLAQGNTGSTAGMGRVVNNNGKAVVMLVFYDNDQGVFVVP